MSVKISTLVWECSSVRGTDRLVMLALADFCDDSGICYPGVARIAAKCLVSERTVQRSFQEMEEIGVLRIEKGRGLPTNGGATNRFSLMLTGGDKLTGGDTQGSKVVTNGVKGGDTAMSPESSVEPSVKSSDDIDLFALDPKMKRELSKTIPLFEAFTTTPIQDLLSEDGFADAWRDYVTARRQLKQPLAPIMATRLLKVLSEQPKRATLALGKMMEGKVWLRFFWHYLDDKPRNGTHSPTERPKPQFNDLSKMREANRRPKL